MGPFAPGRQLRPKMWIARWTSIVDKTRIVRSGEDERRLLNDLVEDRGVRVIGFVNAHAMNSVAVNEAFYEAMMSTDILLRDGVGMAILYRLLEREPGLNMNGTDFIPKLLEAFRGRNVALWGTREPFIGQASARCEAEFGVRVVSMENGFEDFDHYVRIARQTQPDLIVLGMGMPKQEELARELSAAMSPMPLIVCGGAILDFLGGKVPRAPKWVRDLGAEWCYRLYREPRRLCRRYMLGNPAFVAKLMALRRAARTRKAG
jgi:exopolysaccharide biosynthesis WecB/TagA/CpsF family protein